MTRKAKGSLAVFLILAIPLAISIALRATGPHGFSVQQAEQSVRAFEGNSRLHVKYATTYVVSTGSLWGIATFYQFSASGDYRKPPYWDVHAITGEVTAAEYTEEWRKPRPKPVGRYPVQECMIRAEDFAKMKYNQNGYDPTRSSLVEQRWDPYYGWAFDWERDRGFGYIRVWVNPEDGAIQRYRALRAPGLWERFTASHWPPF